MQVADADIKGRRNDERYKGGSPAGFCHDNRQGAGCDSYIAKLIDTRLFAGQIMQFLK